MNKFELTQKKDVKDAKPYDFTIHSDYINLQLYKVVKTSLVVETNDGEEYTKNITHDLKYVPFVLIMIDDATNWKDIGGDIVPWEKGQLLPISLQDFLLYSADENKITIKAASYNSTPIWHFRVYIFKYKVNF
jgi:hypothetical protein